MGNKEQTQDYVVAGKTSVKDLYTKEDWLACWIGFVIIALGAIAVLTGAYDFAALKFKTRSVGEELVKSVPLFDQLAEGVFWKKLLLTFVVLGGLFTVGAKLQGVSYKKFIPAFVVLFVIAFVVQLIFSFLYF